MKVSIICPTFNRPERHRNLYAAFYHQTYQNRELLILDDSPEPSPFFTRVQDNRVKYFHNPVRASIGQKRNLLCEKAAGEIIAHFDDDDYYAPTYLESMVKNLGEADLIKFYSWLAWRELDGSLWEWDTGAVHPVHYIVSGIGREIPTINLKGLLTSGHMKSFLDGNEWGFGFSYVYRKSLWEQCPFLDRNHGEDYRFINQARTLGKTLIKIPDENHLVLHVIQSKSTSRIFPQFRYPSEKALEMLGNEAKPWLVVDL